MEYRQRLGVQKVESGKWKVESGKWKVESEKWKVESGNVKCLAFVFTLCHLLIISAKASLYETARQCIMYYRRCIIGDVKTIGNYQ